MLNFLNIFKKKKVDTQKVKAFDGAIEAINIFIMLSEWEKARKALTEIEYKEKDALNKLIEIIDRQDDEEAAGKEKEKQIDIYKKREKLIHKLKEKLNKKEENYKKKELEERFKIRFKKIKDEVENLKGGNKNEQALEVIKNFLEENPGNKKVINFYNSEKKEIQKNFEKQKKVEKEKFRQNAKLEALNLIGSTVKIEEDKKEDKKENKNLNFFQKIKKKLNFYKKIKESIRKKKLLDEISILIEEDSKVKKDLAAKKLENIHRGLIKEISNDNMVGYELYGKILGADKISGDTFGLYDSEKKYTFFLGDATGHGIRAGFIITLLSRLFNKYVKDSSLRDLIFEINNGLKQDLKSRNFITGIFFEIEKKSNIVKFVGLGHEPMLIYRKNTATVEKVIPGGLAAGIRIMKEKENVKVKEFELNDGDIVLTYSDGIVENKNEHGDFYGIDKLKDTFKNIAQSQSDINKIYEYIINDVKLFRGGTNFLDDASVLLFRRDSEKDIIDEESKFLKDLSIKEGLNKSEVKKLKGKTKTQIEKELEHIKKDKETERIIKNLETLYYTGEILKLKQEAIRFIKEGYIHKKINFYLRKAIDNEKSYKIDQKNQKIEGKYNVLLELYKKGDYNTVIKEAEEIISKDGNV